MTRVRGDSCDWEDSMSGRYTVGDENTHTLEERRSLQDRRRSLSTRISQNDLLLVRSIRGCTSSAEPAVSDSQCSSVPVVGQPNLGVREGAGGCVCDDLQLDATERRRPVVLMKEKRLLISTRAFAGKYVAPVRVTSGIPLGENCVHVASKPRAVASPRAAVVALTR